jgi:small subunit ribosomal protein S4
VARYTGPQVKQSRREGVALTDKAQKYLDRRNYPPGEHGRGRIRQSEYLLQLREKQKTRRFYGVLEKQFRRYYEKASRQQGITGENLQRMLELRLDNVVYRLGFAATRRQARQLVNHGHFRVNALKVDIPSYQVRPDDVITVKPGSSAEPVIRSATELVAAVAPWLQADYDALNGKVLKNPERTEIDTPVSEQLIVEYYSK